ncbi:hypothetical protein PMAYCL1PPCAC_14196, partial [Pristionchus mayeri]
ARHDYWPSYGFENHSLVIPFEKSFDEENFTSWIQANWAHSLSVSAAYLIVIFAGQKLMESRKPFALDTPLLLWNFGLAVFSILGFIRVTPEWVWSWTGKNDLKYSTCVASYTQAVSGFWAQLFVLSKIVELLDTVFIVARKKPLLFLHWYHHISVLVY